MRDRESERKKKVVINDTTAAVNLTTPLLLLSVLPGIFIAPGLGATRQARRRQRKALREDWDKTAANRRGGPL